MLHPFFHAQNPPGIHLDADLDFVLRVAFGSNFEGAHPASPDGALSWAERLGLECRVAARLSAEQGRGSFGPTLVRQLERFRARLAAESSASAEALKRLVDAIQSSKLEAVLLRQSAVGGAEQAPSGTRIDILVRAADEQRLASSLVQAGFASEVRREAWSAPERERAVFTLPSGASISLYTALKFLRMVPGGVFIDFDCLKRCGQLAPGDASPRELWFPSKSVQAADITAQLLVEQRFSAQFLAFSALLVAQSLGLGHDEDVAFDAYLMLQTDIEHAEFEAFRELLRALGAGELSNLSKRAGVLLNHAVASATNPAYRARLQLQRKAQVWQHEGHLERAAERVGKALGSLRNLRTRS